MRPSYQGRADVVAPTTDQTWRDNSASPWPTVRIVRSPEVYPPLVSSSELEDGGTVPGKVLGERFRCSKKARLTVSMWFPSRVCLERSASRENLGTPGRR